MHSNKKSRLYVQNYLFFVISKLVILGFMCPWHHFNDE